MGSGASSLSDEETAKCTRELYAPKPDPNLKTKKAGVFSRAKGAFSPSRVASDDTTMSDSYQHRSISVNGPASTSDIRLFNVEEIDGTRTSTTKLMTRLVYETIPDFLSYTTEDPSGTDLETANSARLLLVTPANYLEFYTTVYESLYDASLKHTFPIRTITFKNDFLSELMKMIVLEGESQTAYSTTVAKFGLKYAKEGIDIIEYGLFGEAIILAMRKIKKGQRLDLWPRVYSRFVRALVPAMVIVTHISAEQLEQLPPVTPGSVEQLQQAHALSRSGGASGGRGSGGTQGQGKKVAFRSSSSVAAEERDGTVAGSQSDQ